MTENSTYFMQVLPKYKVSWEDPAGGYSELVVFGTEDLAKLLSILARGNAFSWIRVEEHSPIDVTQVSP
jgi:hypothetical protein